MCAIYTIEQLLRTCPMTTDTHPFADARRMKPTRRHRAAIWENMLGTVYATNDAGETRYFDYRWDDARAFAGVDQPDRDPRLYRADCSYSGGPRKGQLVLYVKEAAANVGTRL